MDYTAPGAYIREHHRQGPANILSRKQLFPLLLVALVVIAYIVGDGERLLDPKIYQDMFKEQPTKTVLVFFFLFLAGTAMSLPVTGAMSVVSGLVFGHAIGVPLALLACTVGGTIGFLLSRYALSNLVQQRFAVQLKVINDGVKRDGTFYLLSLRMIPVIPFWLLNLLMGLTPMKTASYVLATLAGMFPVILVFVHFGTELAAIDSFTVEGIFTPSLLLSFCLLASMPFVARWLLGLIQGRRGKKPSQADP